MKTIFDKPTREGLIVRVKNLRENNEAKWGKMNIFQMTKHCRNWDAWVLGKGNPTYKQEFMGRIFGKVALKSMIKDDKPLRRNLPAGKGFAVEERHGDIEAQKKIWINLLTEYERFSNDRFIHDFFGKMTKEQIGILAYKHTDHHLRQFGV